MFLPDVKDALEVDRRLHAEVIPASPQEQRALARRLGYEEYARQTFLDDYRQDHAAGPASHGAGLLRGGGMTCRVD